MKYVEQWFQKYVPQNSESIGQEPSIVNPKIIVTVHTYLDRIEYQYSILNKSRYIWDFQS
jgi:hypothetical protein